MQEPASAHKGRRRYKGITVQQCFAAKPLLPMYPPGRTLTGYVRAFCVQNEAYNVKSNTRKPLVERSLIK